MDIFIVYDKRTGRILHKHRLAALENDRDEGSEDCEDKDVLASYRGSVDPDHLVVARLKEYEPRSSRGRNVRFDPASGGLREHTGEE